MATHDYVIANQSGAAFRTDLNNALAAIVSNNSSSSQPATRYAYQWWADTSSGILKLRNSANDAWIDMLNLDGTFVFDLEDGSESAPSLRFADDTNTGIFSSAANTLDITTGGTSKLKVNSTGHVLIGNPTFDKLLSIHAGTDAVFLIEGASNGTSSVFFGHEGDVDAGSIIYNHTANDMVFTAEDDMRFDCLQFGIGISNPVSKLHIKQDSTTAYDDTDDDGQRNAASVCIENGNGTTNTYAQLVFDIADSGQAIARITALRTANSSSSLTFVTEHSNTKSEKMRILSSGEVFIGTKTGSGRFVVQHASLPKIQANFNDAAHFELGVGGSGGGFAITTGHTTTFNHQPYANRGTDTNLSTRLTITGTGNLESGGLIVAAAGFAQVDNAQSLISQSSVGSATTTYFIGNQAITTSSDKRIKENIVDTSLNAITELNKVRVVDFNWNDPSDQAINNKNARGKWIGCIAQEIVDIFPHSVNAPRPKGKEIDYDSEHLWTMEYEHLVPVLIKAVQELSAKVAALESV